MSLSLGPFDLDTLADRGPRGSVWRAVHRPTGRVVTIEVAAADESARMLHGVRALARLGHRAVHGIHAFGRVPLDLRPDRPDRRAALSPGAVWRATAPLDRRPWSTLTTWAALRDTLDALLYGLAHGHAHRVIHRDLSLETVALTADGPVITGYDRASLDGVLPPGDASPGGVEGDRAFGPWTDLSAAGELVVRLLTGGDAGTPVELGRLARQVAEAPIDAPPALADWLTRLLTPRPERFRFAADAARALRALDGGAPSPDLTLHEPTALTGHVTRHDEPYASTLTLEAGQLAAASRAGPIPLRCPRPVTPLVFAEVGATLASLRSGPLVGRDALTGRLWTELRSAAGGHTRLVVLEGPAGSGKGHVAQHVARLAHAHGVAEYVVAKHPLDSQPGSGIGAALAELLWPGIARDGLDGLGPGLDGRLAAMTADTLGPTDHSAIERAASSDPRLVDPAAIEACITLIGTLCVARPLIVQIDDAQWAPGALRLARRLLDAHRALPLLMIVCTRDEPDPRAAAAQVLVAQLTLHPRVTRLMVPPLDAAEIAALVARRVTLPPAEVEALVAAAHGLPRRAIDQLRALVEGGPAPSPATRLDPAPRRVRGTTNPLPPVEPRPVDRPRTPPARPADPLDLAPQLGPYVLLGRAGHGGAGEVWKAFHRAEHVTLAIKFVTTAGTDRNRRHFERELRAVARMDHPHIIRVHDRGRTPPEIADRCGLTAGAPYIVMDWHGGGTLRGSLGAVDYPTLRHLLTVLLDALAHAHARDVIHRDLKPDNILLGDAGPVVTDFGVALTLDGIDGERGPRGTPGYMAPEQIRNQSHRVGPWTDLYALGCLTHALVTGRPPFGSSPPLDVMQRHLDQAAPSLVGDFPPGFAAWVARLLHKDPGQRFRFAAHARAALPRVEPTDHPEHIDTLEDPPTLGTATRLGPITRPLIRLRQPGPTGRATEREALWSALDAALAGPTTTAFLVEGPSGTGKTALVRWLARRAHALGRALSLSAHHQRHTGPADGLAPMLDRALRLTDLDDTAAVAHVRELLALDRYDPLARAIVAATRPHGHARDSQELVALGTRHEHFATLGHALARLCALTPQVLHIDDAQWAPEAIDFVRHLYDHHPDLPLLVIVTVSHDQLDPRGDAAAALRALTADAPVRRLGLTPLSDDALAEMIRRLAPASPELIGEITRRAAGSPLLAELLLERWLDTDALAAGPDGLRLRTRPPGLAPAAHALWIARLEDVLAAAGPATWQALELAATLGVVVDRREWRALAAADAPRLAPSTLATLCDAGLARDGATAWSFAHAMLREALVERARLAGRLATHHARCARALATLPDVDPKRRARHHHAAGDPAAALPLYLTAAARARRRTDITATRRALFGALRALRHHPDPILRVEITARWALTDKSRGHLDRARRHAHRARHLARTRAPDDPRATAWAAYAVGEVTLQSDPPGADIQLARAYRAAVAAGEPQLAARALEARGWALFHRGQLDEIDPLLELTPDFVETLDDPLYEGNLVYLRAIVARARGDLTAAPRHLARARLLFRVAGSRHGLGSVRNEFGELAFARGHYQAAYDHYLAFLELGEALAHRSVAIAALNLGRACDVLGRTAEGERRRRHALRLATRDGDPAMSAFARVCLLVDVARDGRFPEFDVLIDALDLLRDGTLVAPEAADAAQRAADLCAAAGEHARAARAIEIAAVQNHRLGR